MSRKASHRAFIGFCYAILAIAPSFPAYADRADEYHDIHSIGIISAIGNKLALSKIGSTVFGNGYSELSTRDWGLDNLVAQKISAAIGGRFATRIVSADTTPLESYENTLLGPELPDLKKFVLGLPASNGVDAYVIVRKTLGQDTSGTSGVNLWGIGLYHHNLIFGGAIDALYAFYDVEVIDAKTGRQIDYGVAHLTDSGLLSPLASQESPATDWAETADAMTDQQRADVRAALQAMIEKTLPIALEKAQLLQPTSDQAAR